MPFWEPHAYAYLSNRRNEIGQLPSEVGDMHALRSLRAHSNNLESLPTSVGGLVSLELCDLGSNRHVLYDPLPKYFLDDWHGNGYMSHRVADEKFLVPRGVSSVVAHKGDARGQAGKEFPLVFLVLKGKITAALSSMVFSV